MELNIIDGKAMRLDDQFGIKKDRFEELVKKMDDHFMPFIGSGGQMYLHEHLQFIASICDTLEEFALCEFLHMRWLYSKGVKFI